jgi:phosphoribosylaminoimidazolecarboxamide formyltransferase/IMP cyclohydrolase
VPTKQRALVSVADKRGIVELARRLVELSFEIVSTGGTAAALRAGGVPVTDVAEVTGFPEIMDGRVKTLHPRIHGGLLARRGSDDAVLAEHGIDLIDLVVVNLYPFEDTIARPDVTEADAIENIDVGGPAMLRAAAKNHERVIVVVDHADYEPVLSALAKAPVRAETKRRLAAKAFAHTARYDAAISGYLQRAEPPQAWPDPLVTSWPLTQPLRYGENPHQRAALYRSLDAQPGSLGRAAQLQGKELSYNNLADADAALQCVNGFDAPACVIVKHASPCGVATGSTAIDAYVEAYRADPASAFGGVIAFNRPLDEATAAAILARQRADVIVAPRIDDAARAAFAKKAGVRLLATGDPPARASTPTWEYKTIEGGLLVQERDAGRVDIAQARVVTRRAPSESELSDLQFAWDVVKHVKSNAIVYARGGATLGIGAGQPSRVMSARIAALKAAEARLDLQGAAMASDAFFPFRDGIDVAAEHGIRAVAQPGGAVRDDEIIGAANEHGIAMVFTGMRHFRH